VLEPPPVRMDSSAPRVHPQHALAVYAESLTAGARVALFGDSSVGLAERVVGQGAHEVQVWDPDFARARAEVERAPRGVNVHAYSNQDVAVREVDLAIVADLGLFGDVSGLIGRLRRMVGQDGVAIIAARSAEISREDGVRAFDYYELFDLVAAEFQSVRMVAQLSFFGVALVELGDQDESTGVNVDTQLGESGRAPEAFVVVASQRDARLDAYSIVELPSPPRPESDDGEALAQAQLRAAWLTSQLQDLRTEMARTERSMGAVPALEESLRGRAARAVELEKALAERGRELAELSSEVEEMRAAAAAGRVAAVQVEELALRAERAERRSQALEQELAKAADAQSRELVRLEEVLRERAKGARVLEIEVARGEQMVRDLVATLDEVQGAPARSPAETEPEEGSTEGMRADGSRALTDENARLQAQLDALALDLARREGDAQATAWQIAELERQLAQVTHERDERLAQEREPEANSASPLDRQLAQRLDELDALRKALAQEHEARIRAESGEELARARAEIERQAVLMQQLVRDLETGHSSNSGEDSR
jgi:hypothetical protein